MPTTQGGSEDRREMPRHRARAAWGHRMGISGESEVLGRRDYTIHSAARLPDTTREGGGRVNHAQQPDA
jgi:hypothetical protein